MALLAAVERDDAMRRVDQLDQQILKMLIPRDNDDDKGVILEVRAGTGIKPIIFSLKYDFSTWFMLLIR